MTEAGPEPPAGHTQDDNEADNEFWIGIGITVVIALMMTLLTHRFPKAETVFYEPLQSTFAKFVSIRPQNILDPPVVVVDISDLPAKPVNGLTKANGETIKVTSRQDLKRLLLTIAFLRPRAIGVDIDFAPGQNDLLTPEDLSFFKFCRSLRNGANETNLEADRPLLAKLEVKEIGPVPVFLGVERSVGRPKKYWLGIDDYSELAASIHFDPDDTTRTQRWIENKDAKNKSAEKLFTMSAALADPQKKDQTEPASIVNLFVENSKASRIAGQFEAESFLVDYTPLQALIKGRIRADADLHKTDVDLRKNSSGIEGKIVLIGDGTYGKDHDQFPVPGQKHLQLPETTSTVPGIYLHACAVATLMQHPLYEFRLLPECFIDIVLGLAVVARFAWIRKHHRGPANGNKEDQLQHLYLIWAVFLSLPCILLVVVLDVMWLDFPFILLGLLLHKPIEHGCMAMYAKLPDPVQHGCEALCNRLRLLRVAFYNRVSVPIKRARIAPINWFKRLVKRKRLGNAHDVTTPKGDSQP